MTEKRTWGRPGRFRRAPHRCRAGAVCQKCSHAQRRAGTTRARIGLQDPALILVVQPTLEMAETWSKGRLTPMLRRACLTYDEIDDALRLIHRIVN